MANMEQLAKLREGTLVWNEWIVSLSSDFHADLSYANLRDANLRDANLRDANLRDANLRDANLRDANLVNANLAYANLTEANLVNADLGNANLRDANLRDADLSNADLTAADLTGADLTGADLSEAALQTTDLNKANLANADLSNADLVMTNFSNAVLIGAKLPYVELYETIFGNTNLSNVIGLEDAIHQGPSILDHRTLEQSGQLPLSFLRGCGLPELLIDYLPSLLNQPISFYSCFISYSHEDKVFARRLHDQLQGKGIRCWLDEHQLLPGDDIYEQVDQGIRLWDKVLLCASESALTSWWVENEIKKAFKKEQVLMKQRKRKVLSLIPLNIDGHLFEWENGLADEVRSRLAPSFEGWETDNTLFEQAFENVVKALETDNTGREAPPPSKL